MSTRSSGKTAPCTRCWIRSRTGRSGGCSCAFDVNNQGEIVGNGRAGKRNDSEEHGFLARPENPAGNQPPIASPDAYTIQANTNLTVSAPGVLANDTDSDGDWLTAALDAGPSAGTLSLSADGSFAYVPEAGFTGEDSFSYVANDGTADSNVTTVTIHVTAEPAATMHVGDLDGQVNDLGRFWQALVTIAVVDETGLPVANATVNGSWSGNASGSESVTTGADGRVVVDSPKVLDKKDHVIFTVDSILHGALDYAPSDNTDPDGDSNGMSIVVYQNGATGAAALARESVSETSQPLTSATVQPALEISDAGRIDPDGARVKVPARHLSPSVESTVDGVIADIEMQTLDDGLLTDLISALF